MASSIDTRVVDTLIHLEYIILDVFTREPFGGSRLTLFPDGGDVPEALMQRLANEMGCGETAFVLSDRKSRGQRASLRVFTPMVELPFAGHSVLGATFAFDHLGYIERVGDRAQFTWKLESGSYEVTLTGNNEETIYSLRQEPPVFLGQYFHRDKVARTLGLPEADIAITGLPCEIVSTGLPIHIVPVASLEVMRTIKLRQREADTIARDLGFGDLYAFTCETVDPTATVHCRMFAPYMGIPEDPASGTAAGALAAYLVKHRLIKLSDQVNIVCEQGLEMGRPSLLFADLEVRTGQASNIRVGGHCVLVGKGQIQLP